jgi:hypothetical protein
VNIYRPGDQELLRRHGEVETVVEAFIGNNIRDWMADPFFNFLFTLRCTERMCLRPSCGQEGNTPMNRWRGSSQAQLEPLLNLPIPRGGSTLGQNIEEYFTQPSTQNSYCEQCLRDTQMHSYSSLGEVPDCLIVSIQRLRHGHEGITKDEDLIDIGNQSLLIQCPRGAVSLRLSSVLEHKGSVRSGHFVAHVAHDRTFFEVDDNKPIIRSEDNIRKGSLFFYTKM